MKNFKRYKLVGLGLGLIIILATAVLSLSPKILAACAPGEVCGGGSSGAINDFLTKADLDNATYTIATGEIDGLIKGNTVKFLDKNPTDSTYNYKPVSTLFCDGTPFGQSGPKGITLNVNPNTVNDTSVNLSENIDYIDSNGSCQNYQTTLIFTKQADGSYKGVTTTATAAQSGGSSGTSACVFKTNNEGWDKALSWILCPVVNGLSASADGINQFVEGQLNFNVDANLSGSVHKAWTVFRSLTSAILVIVMLVMVFSQAIGGGPFDAYTVRKMLPKLVAAVILMQISWELCIWLIKLSNYAGQGIADLLAAPFGGTGSLDLASLLNRLSPVWAGVVGVGTTAGVVTAMFFFGSILTWGWPILVLTIILVLIAVIVAMATLLFRNAFIVLLVILSPLAFLAYILPGTENYWKIWKTNFTRLLIFFPLVMAMIYGGRIFAWTAGNLGDAGPLDLIMVIAGFFGPYFFLPKSFKWGGNFLAMASKGINEAWPVRKGREVANRELLSGERSAMKRKMYDYGKRNIDPESEDYFKYSWRRGPLGIPYMRKEGGKFGKTIMDNLLAGRVLPTRRALGVAIQKQDESNTFEKAIIGTIAERGRQKATSRNRDIAAGKEQSRQMVQRGLQRAFDATGGNPNATEAQKATEQTAMREAEAGLRDLIQSRSFYELARLQIVDPTDGDKKYIWQTDLWRNTIASDKDLYSIVSQERPDWAPHRLPTGLPKYRGELSSGRIAEIRDSMPGASEAAIQAAIDVELNSPKNLLLQDESTNPHNPVRAELVSALGANRAHRIIRETQFADALGEVMGETDARKLSTVSPIMFERIGDMAKDGADLQTDINAAVRAGNASLADQLRDRQNMLLAPSRLFRDMAQNLINTGNEYQLSQIMGGAEATGMIDHALEYTTGGKGIVQLMQEGKIKTAPSPGELKIVHEQAYNTAIPPGTTIAPTQGPVTAAGVGPAPNPNREAYKAQLLADPSTVQALAHGLAYDVNPGDRAAQLSLLREIRDTVATRGPEEARKFNNILDQIQQAYSQRITATAQAVAARGRDPAAASRAAQNRLAPEMAEVETLRNPPTSPTGTP